MICVILIIASCTKVKDKKAVTNTTKKDSVKVEKNAAQTYIDAKKTNIDNAKANVEKSNKATEDQKKEIDNLLGN